MKSGKPLLRKYEDNLYVCGMGVIILGAWDILKLIMQVILESKYMFNVTADVKAEDRGLAQVIMIAAVVIVLLLSILIFLVHVYIGRNAMKAAKGQPYKKGYFVWAIIILALLVLGMYFYVDDIIEMKHLKTTIASIIVDITSIYILATVVVTTVKIKKLKATQTEE